MPTYQDERGCFERPEDIIERRDLDAAQKREILEGWRAQELAILRADSEGMAPADSATQKRLLDRPVGDEAGNAARFIQKIDRLMDQLG